MSDSFSNFLSGVAGGVFGSVGNLRDYQHASRLYVANNYARAPKFGFLYFVKFNLNQGVVKNATWLNQGRRDIGFLVKKLDLPKFSISNETVNQYNKKTVIQTAIKYNPITMDFHDDNSDITTALWAMYYKYYYADSIYADNGSGVSAAFNNKNGGTKYGSQYAYGLSNGQNNPFFDSIDIYVLHQHKFTQYTLINPMITEWSHDSLDQSEPNKILANKMTLAYENVAYKNGKISKSGGSGAFTAVYYDNTPSPLSVAGNGSSTLFGQGGVIAGVDNVLDRLSSGDFLGAAIVANTTIKNAKNITSSSLKNEGYSIVNGVLGNISASGQPGGLSSQNIAQTGLGVLGTVGVNLFSGKNSSVNNSTPAVPVSVTGK